MRPLRFGTILSAAGLIAQVGLAGDGKPAETRIEHQVRRELVTLPYYNLFDSLSFRNEGDLVTLIGKVTRPTLKSDAEKVVRQIEGIGTVRNQIQVLPFSASDDRLRLSLYRAIYGNSVLQTLAIRSVPPIHILVENGHVTLEGAVANSLQKSVADLQANTVAGVVSVTNNLLVDESS
jgi:hyperosmotically inducible protein